MARPPLKIDPAVVENAAALQCTMEEIGAICGCSVATLERRFADIIKTARLKGNMSLRRRQFKLAEKSATMAIFLGKQWLNQKDESYNAQPQYTKITLERSDT